MAVLYGLEGFLRRLAASDDRNSFILKGGVLLAAFDVRRPTRDADLLALDLANDREVVEAKVAQIAAVSLPDGLVLEVGSLASEVIRDDDEYSGIRVKLTYSLATMNIRIGVDVNVGDPVYPAPQDISMPGLLGDAIRLRGYPLSAVIAEKAVTGMQRGVANTRWRDWADIWSLARRHAFDADEVAAAITVVAQHRKAAVQPLSRLIPDYPTIAQARWAAWRRRPDVTQGLPEAFRDVLIAASQFIDPAIEGPIPGLRWNPLIPGWEQTSS